jgi:cyclase
VRVPGRAHTDGDLVVWAPRDGVLFNGDLLFSGVVPLAVSGSVVGWLAALDWLAQFDAQHLVPGHGPLTDPRQTCLAVRDYLRWLLDAVAGDANPDYTDLEKQARTLWPRWLDGERHAVNLRVTHAELHGSRCDLNTALAAMRTAAGGVISPNL